jgi:hypothetical protein
VTEILVFNIDGDAALRRRTLRSVQFKREFFAD